MGDKIANGIADAQELILALLSWSVLAALSIIISGKLVTKRLPIGLVDDALFSIPLIIFKIRARGEEVSVGFAIFIITFGFVICFGGKPAYEFFREHAGIDIGHWSSLCAVASFISLLFSAMVCVIAPFFKSVPLVSSNDRNEVNDRLRSQS